MKLKGRNKVSPEFSMSSMTDIVFLLLVFFMLTSNAPNALDLLLPKAQGKTINKQNVSVSVNNRGHIYLDSKKVQFDYLESELKKIVQGIEEPVLNIRAEENVPYGQVIKIMDIANRNKIKVIAEMRPPSSK